MKKVTITDVAKSAKVSKSTVSQFLNNRYEYMSIATKKKIEQAIQELNYHPNIVARSLKQKSTFTIGIIVANIVHSFSTQFIRALETTLQEKGFHLIVCNADDEPEKERKHIEILLAKQVDGLILFPTGGNMDLYDAMKNNDFPVIFIDRVIENSGVPSILLDNFKASVLAVNHFIAHHYQHIAIITNPIFHNITPRLERIEGYKQALQANGLAIEPNYIKTVKTENINDALDELFSLEQRPKAILAGNDRILLGLLSYLNTKKLCIPHDIAVIGIDDVPFADCITPPITTLKQPIEQMAHKAAQILLEKINDRTYQIDKLILRFEPILKNRASL